MRILSLAIATAGLVFTSGVNASPRSEWARVLRADPIVEAYRVPVSQEVCHAQPVTVVERSSRRSDNRAPALIGAVLGYQAVRNDQKRHDVYYGGGTYTTYQDVCRIETRYVTEQRVVGYDVTYRHRGELHRVRTDHHPGDRIRVAGGYRSVRY